jgi:hypothetical protein
LRNGKRQDRKTEISHFPGRKSPQLNAISIASIARAERQRSRCGLRWRDQQGKISVWKNPTQIVRSNINEIASFSHREPPCEIRVVKSYSEMIL